MKKSKADQKKIVTRYIKKLAEYSEMTNEELVEIGEDKRSSTDHLAYRDAVNKKMMESITNERAIKEEEKLAPDEPIINLIDEGNKSKFEQITSEDNK